MKEKYISPDMTVVFLETDDVITTSDGKTELPPEELDLTF